MTPEELIDAHAAAYRITDTRNSDRVGVDPLRGAAYYTTLEEAVERADGMPHYVITPLYEVLPEPALPEPFAVGARVRFTQRGQENVWGVIAGPPQYDSKLKWCVAVSWEDIDKEEPVRTPINLLAFYG